MQIDDKEYVRLIKQNARYHAALVTISDIARGISMGIDGWVSAIRTARSIATVALTDNG